MGHVGRNKNLKDLKDTRYKVRGIAWGDEVRSVKMPQMK